ncbi:hypothetical protein GF312_09900, partial [Candidatus Poribacteria bacterium]|nr:hypothetical protein [Candidatus Poribacteria bacterium]
MFGKYAGRYFFGLILMMMFITGSVYGRGVGTSGSTALNMGVGARSVAMGEASAAVSDDVSGIY